MKKHYIILISVLLFSGINGCIKKEELKQPQACFTPSKNTATINEIITFDNCSVDAERYGWDFGDGTTSTDISPAHSYTQSGQKIVKLKAFNQTLYDEITKVITIEPDQTQTPTACFTISATEVKVGDVVQFTNCSTNASSYSWDFGDGTSSTQTSPSHTYQSANTYTVILTAQNGADYDEISHTILVNPQSTQTAPVTFNVNMNVQIAWGYFNPSADYVDIAGTFNDWGTTQKKMNDTDGDGIYTLTITDLAINSGIEYKFRVNGTWDYAENDINNRSLTVSSGGNTVTHWFNDVDKIIVDPYAYTGGIPESVFSDYLIEDFNSSTSDYFSVYTGTDFNKSISGGNYILENFNTTSSYLFYSSSDSPDQTKNWEIELKFKTVNYTPYGAGFMWGLNDSSYDYYFFFTDQYGNYETGNHSSSSWFKWLDWTTGGNTAPNYNLITIRKLSNTYYMFVNGNFVFEHDFASYFGARFGFHVPPSETMYVDYVHIMYINLNFGKGELLPAPPIANTNSKFINDKCGISLPDKAK